MKTSPLAPRSFPQIPSISGVSFGSGAFGLKYLERKDLLLVLLDEGTSVAGVFTTSKTASAPVLWCRRQLSFGKAQALIVNAGNANAFTGMIGERVVNRIVSSVAKSFSIPEAEVFVASTGVIGEMLAEEKIVKAIPKLKKKLSSDDWLGAASSIMTTDTYPKGAWRSVKIGDSEVLIGGIAKGSGMIAPDMATMLSFIFTDAKIPPVILQKLINRGAEKSFNSITVDSDTSTSDTCLLFSTGAVEHAPILSVTDKQLKNFRAGLEEIMVELAQQIVRDGEGATKLVTINVLGAKSKKAAKKIGLSIGNSPLVKTAIAGEDPNWGRIVMAIGKSGEVVDRDKLSIKIGGVSVAENGVVVPSYDEALAALHLKGREVKIDVDLQLGRGGATTWTCDLTHEYISINADYRS